MFRLDDEVSIWMKLLYQVSNRAGGVPVCEKALPLWLVLTLNSSFNFLSGFCLHVRKIHTYHYKTFRLNVQLILLCDYNSWWITELDPFWQSIPKRLGIIFYAPNIGYLFLSFMRTVRLSFLEGKMTRLDKCKFWSSHSILFHDWSESI